MPTLIITGGKINRKFIIETIKKKKYNNVIAVDKGLEILDKIGIVPNYIIGDFDSVNEEILKQYENDKKIKIYKYSSEKDYTDTHIAINKGIELGKSIEIIGAIGNRQDHTIANIQTLLEGLNKNIIIKIINENNQIQLINKTTEIEKNKKYKYVSLISLTEEVNGITLEGFKYKLDNYTLKLGQSIGISNEIIEEKAKIKIKKGILICIESKD